jgi:hypothetical protein
VWSTYITSTCIYTHGNIHIHSSIDAGVNIYMYIYMRGSDEVAEVGGENRVCVYT